MDKDKYMNLPSELQKNGLFCAWKYETNDKGNLTKVPYNIKTGFHASSTNRETFCEFQEALQAGSEYDGLGIGIFDDVAAVDIDHCISENGAWNDMALDIAETMDCYTERSPSGHGLRFLFRSHFRYDKQKYYINNQSIGLEVYISGMTNKFVTVTGNAIQKTDLEDRSEQIKTIVEKYMRKPETGTQNSLNAAENSPSDKLELDDKTLLETAFQASNGDKFRKLYEGDNSGYFTEGTDGTLHEDASAGDQAFCLILAFWTGNNKEQMDRIFRNSGRMRKKWLRDDYRENTLNFAISHNSEGYIPKEDFEKAWNDFLQEHPEGEDFEERMKEKAACLEHSNSDPVLFPDNQMKLPDIVNYAEVSLNPPKLKPELIHSILRQGHKMIITSGSKAGKTFLLTELALAISNGSDWLGFKCEEGRVLYVNMEVDAASFFDRIARVSRALQLDHTDKKNLDVWNLRGCGLTLENLTPVMIRRCTKENYSCIILDPLYKLLTGDENSAHDMALFCGLLDRVCNELGVSLVYAHHHSKGSQALKNSMDRGSGSGVFARDPDAILDVGEIDPSSVGCVLPQTYNTAFRVEGTLREFPMFQPFEIIFDYPIHYRYEGLQFAKMLTGSRSGADAGTRASVESNKAKQNKNDAEMLREIKEYYEMSHDYPSVKQLSLMIGKNDRTLRDWINKSETVVLVEKKVIPKP